MQTAAEAALTAHRIEFARNLVDMAAVAARIEPVSCETAKRIAQNVIEHGGSVYAAIHAARRYIAARVVREQLARIEPQKSENAEPALWVGAIVFGAAIAVLVYEAARVMGIAP